MRERCAHEGLDFDSAITMYHSLGPAQKQVLFDLVREETSFNGGLQGLFAGVRYTW